MPQEDTFLLTPPTLCHTDPLPFPSPHGVIPYFSLFCSKKMESKVAVMDTGRFLPHCDATDSASLWASPTGLKYASNTENGVIVRNTTSTTSPQEWHLPSLSAVDLQWVTISGGGEGVFSPTLSCVTQGTGDSVNPTEPSEDLHRELFMARPVHTLHIEHLQEAGVKTLDVPLPRSYVGCAHGTPAIANEMLAPHAVQLLSVESEELVVYTVFAGESATYRSRLPFPETVREGGVISWSVCGPLLGCVVECTSSGAHSTHVAVWCATSGTKHYHMVYRGDAASWQWVPKRIVLLRQHAVVWGDDGFILDIARATRRGGAERLWQSGGGSAAMDLPSHRPQRDDVMSVSSAVSTRTTAMTLDMSVRSNTLQEGNVTIHRARSALGRMSTRRRGAPRKITPAALDMTDAEECDQARLPKNVLQNLCDSSGSVRFAATLDCFCIVVTEDTKCTVHCTQTSDLRWTEVSTTPPKALFFTGTSLAASPVSGLPLLFGMGGDNGVSLHAVLQGGEKEEAVLSATAVTSRRLHSKDAHRIATYVIWVKRAVVCRDATEFCKALNLATELSTSDRDTLARICIKSLASMCGGDFDGIDLTTSIGVDTFKERLATTELSSPHAGRTALSVLAEFFSPLSEFIMTMLQSHNDASAMLLLRQLYLALLKKVVPKGEEDTTTTKPVEPRIVPLMLKSAAALPRRWSRMFVEGVMSAREEQIDSLDVEAALSSCAFLFTVGDLARLTQPASFSPTASEHEEEEDAVFSGSDAGSGPKFTPGTTSELASVKRRIAELALEGGLGVLQVCLNLNKAAFCCGLYTGCISGACGLTVDVLKKAENRSALLWGWLASGALQHDKEVSAPIVQHLEARAASTVLPLSDVLLCPLPLPVIVGAVTRIAIDLLATRSGDTDAPLRLLHICFLYPLSVERQSWQDVAKMIALATIDGRTRSRLLERLRADGIQFSDDIRTLLEENEPFLKQVREGLAAKQWAVAYAQPKTTPAIPVYQKKHTQALETAARRSGYELYYVTARSITDTGSQPCPPGTPVRSGPFLRLSLQWASSFPSDVKSAILIEAERVGARTPLAIAGTFPNDAAVGEWCFRHADCSLAWAFGEESAQKVAQFQRKEKTYSATYAAMSDAACLHGDSVHLDLVSLARCGMLVDTEVPKVRLCDVLSHSTSNLLQMSFVQAHHLWDDVLYKRSEKTTLELLTHAAYSGALSGGADGYFTTAVFCEGVAQRSSVLSGKGASLLECAQNGFAEVFFPEGSSGPTDPVPLLTCLMCSAAPLSALGLDDVLRETLQRAAPLLAEVSLPLPPPSRQEPSTVVPEAFEMDVKATEGDTSLLEAFTCSASLICDLNGVLCSKETHLSLILTQDLGLPDPQFLAVAEGFSGFAACSAEVLQGGMLDARFFLAQGRPFAALEFFVRFLLKEWWDGPEACAAKDQAKLLRNIASGGIQRILEEEDGLASVVGALSAALKDERSGVFTKCGLSAALHEVFGLGLDEPNNADMVRAVLIFLNFFGVSSVGVSVDLVAYTAVLTHCGDIAAQFRADFLEIFGDYLYSENRENNEGNEGNAVHTTPRLRAAQRILDLWESIAGVAEAEMYSPTSKALPSSVWSLLSLFSLGHHLGPFVRHLSNAMQMGDWAGLLWSAQHGDIPLERLAGLLEETPQGAEANEIAAAQHLTSALKATGAELPDKEHPKSSFVSLFLHTILPLGKAKPSGSAEVLQANLLFRAAFTHATPFLAVLGASAFNFDPRHGLVVFLLASLLENHSARGEKDFPSVTILADVVQRRAPEENIEGDAIHSKAVDSALLGEACLKALGGEAVVPDGESAEHVLRTLLLTWLPEEVWGVASDCPPLLLFAAERGFDIFLPTSFLRPLLKLCKAVHRGDWGSVSRVASVICERTVQHPFCLKLLTTLLTTAPREQVRLLFLESLEEGGYSPLDHGILPSKVVRKVEKAVAREDALEKVRWRRRPVRSGSLAASPMLLRSSIGEDQSSARLSFGHQPYSHRSYATDPETRNGTTDTTRQLSFFAALGDWQNIGVLPLVAALKGLKLYSAAEDVLTECATYLKKESVEEYEKELASLSAIRSAQSMLGALLSTRWMIIPPVLISTSEESRNQGNNTSSKAPQLPQGMEGVKALLGARGVAMMRALNGKGTGSTQEGTFFAVAVGLYAADVMARGRPSSVAVTTTTPDSATEVAVVAALALCVGIHSVRVTHVSALEYVYSLTMFASEGMHASSNAHRRGQMLEKTAQRIAGQRHDILSAFHYFESAEDFSHKLRESYVSLFAATVPQDVSMLPELIASLDESCLTCTDHYHDGRLLQGLYEQVLATPQTAALLLQEVVQEEPHTPVKETQAGTPRSPGSPGATSVPAEDETIVMAATLLSSPTGTATILKSDAVRGQVEVVLLGCGCERDWWREPRTASDVVRVLRSLQLNSVQTVAARHEIRRLVALVSAADLTGKDMTKLNSMTPTDLYSALLHASCRLRQNNAPEERWTAAIALLDEVVQVYTLSTEETALLTVDAVTKWCYAPIALNAAAQKKLAFVIADYIGGRNSSPFNSSDASSQRGLLGSCEEGYFPSEGNGNGEQAHPGDGESRPVPERPLLISSVQGVFRQFFERELHREGRSSARTGFYTELFLNDRDTKDISRAAESLGCLRDVTKAQLQQLAGNDALVIAKDLLERANQIRSNLAACKGPPANWLGSIALEVAVVSIVHASWLGERYFDPSLHSSLMSVANAILREAVNVNEVEAVSPLILCGSFRSEALVEEVMTLLLSRSSTNAVLHLFTQEPELWGEAHCYVFQHLQRRVTTSVPCRDLLQKIHTKLAMNANLGELLEAQAHTRIRSSMDQAAALSLPVSSPPQRYGKTKKTSRTLKTRTSRSSLKAPLSARGAGLREPTSPQRVASREALSAFPLAQSYYEGSGTYYDSSVQAAEVVQAMHVVQAAQRTAGMTSPRRLSAQHSGSLLSSSPPRVVHGGGGGGGGGGGVSTPSSGRRDSTMADALRSQNMFLTKAADLFRSAAMWYVKGKCCASARRCLNVADLVDLQCKTLIAERKV